MPTAAQTTPEKLLNDFLESACALEWTSGTRTSFVFRTLTLDEIHGIYTYGRDVLSYTWTEEQVLAAYHFVYQVMRG
jgi:hypothetical protein